MKTTKMLTILVLALLLVVWQAEVSKAEPMGTAWTYQGRLMDANAPAEGLYDFQFKLCGDPNTSSHQVGDTIDINDLDVIDGYFTVALDFNEPNAFNGEARWLDIGVRPGNSSERYTILSPRQHVTPTPYALYAETTSDDNDWIISGDDMYSIPTGNVGIGSTNPTAKLEVAGDMTIAIEDDIVLSLVSGISNSSKIALGQRFNNESAVIELDNTTGVLRFGRPFDSNSLAIDNSGNVGIGTTSPTKKLEVVGDVTVKKSDEDVDLSLVSGIGSSSELLLGNRFEPGAAAIKFDNLTQILSFKNWLTDDALVIAQDGNVGISTETPQAKLHVEGGARVSDDLSVQGKLTVDDAYVGSFPRPAYISAWVSVTPGTNHTFYHNLGGDPNDYFVDLTFKSNKIHHFYYGGTGHSWGAYWWDLDASEIKVFREPNDTFANTVRVRIWVYK
ncbi:MAG: hypothetical protein ACYS6W_01500 [Planctomycetota bacterium]|jgi:hypothetical protein